MTIVSHSNDSQTRWDRGDFKVMIASPTSSRPLGFCDGTEEDEHELIEQAMEEGTEVVIEKKPMKSGREVWTVRSTVPTEDFEE